MVEEKKESLCPRCNSYYAGKVPVLDFKDPEYVSGERETPPIIMTKCHGVHPKDPWEGKD